MKKLSYDSNTINTLNKIYVQVCKLSQNFDILIDVAISEAKRSLDGSVSPVIQCFKPQNQCSEQPKKKRKDTVKIKCSKFVDIKNE